MLTHHRFPNQNDLLDVSGGWHTHLDTLLEHLRGRTSPGLWARHAALNGEYEQRLGIA